MSDLLREALASYTPRFEGSSQTVEMTIDQLEWMAARISRLEEAARDRSKIEERLQELVKRTERELNSYKKTVRNLQPKHLAATSERGQFELAKNAAEQRAAKLEEALQKSRAETQALRDKMADRTPSELEAKYESARAEREKMEKKLESAHKERDFFRDRYQEGAGTASEQASEIADLRARIQDLERKAGDTVVRVHEINGRHTAEEYRRQREEQAAYVAQLEQQVEQTRKELQALKSNRRETRATSVPRSPRLNVMSPRTRGAGGNTSRGNSPAPFDGGSAPSSAAGPVPGMTFYQPPGSHPRFSHLRE
jgi:chromosome segregation ATPase